ncbi:MAG: hypothetical protein M1305_02245 [Candidatus Marsarchaeota archaeon]|nr:hypothetical protein [Candidatus Marsarchaeota archaeon]
MNRARLQLAAVALLCLIAATPSLALHQAVLLATVKAPVRPQDYMDAVLLSRDGNVLVCASNSEADIGTLSVWNARTGKLLKQILSDAGFERAILSPNGKFVAGLEFGPADSGSDQDFMSFFVVRVWNIRTGRLKLSTRVGFLRSLVFSPDSRTLAIATLRPQEEDKNNRKLLLYDTATWKPRAATHLEDYVYHMAFSPDGTLLACFGHKKNSHRLNITIFDTRTGKEVRDYKDIGSQMAMNPLFISDTKIVIGSCVLDLDSARGKLRRLFERTKRPRILIGLYGNGTDSILYGIHGADQAELRDSESGEVKRTWRIPALTKKNGYWMAGWRSVANKVLAVQENKNTISIWRLD